MQLIFRGNDTIDQSLQREHNSLFELNKTLSPTHKKDDSPGLKLFELKAMDSEDLIDEESHEMELEEEEKFSSPPESSH